MLPPRGEGPAADQTIQDLLERDWPRDLPARQERQLRSTGAALLRADAIGVGHDHFPAAFGRRQPALAAPAFSRFRIQAVIARIPPALRLAVLGGRWCTWSGQPTEAAPTAKTSPKASR
ncbi:hypothetical protein JGB26_40295 [Streptomyces flavofungini]|uniref:Uncharacterized protein n=1 Tax=Streptomyces flavofungini TaxID=68200 RepID=A0ABS0XJ36_9ACTN|nr:hypothetical protein [Streptomyces flavofungini]MBJ3813225.1 hypothetical protein [Streptomyces flavofungini]